MNYSLKTVEDRMGIVTPMQSIKRNHTKIVRVFMAALFFLVTVVSFQFLTVQPALAADFVPVGQASSFGWLNDSTLRAQGTLTSVRNIERSHYLVDSVNTISFVDSNPYDANRTFRSQAGPSVNYCSNGAVDTITMGSTPSGATLTYIATPPPKGNLATDVLQNNIKITCEVKTRSISLTGISSAFNEAFPCENKTTNEAREACEIERSKKLGNAVFAKTCSSPYSSGQELCTATGAPPYAPGGDTGEEDNTNDREPHPCDSLGDFSLRWVTCPLLTAGIGFADAADALIEDQLHYGTNIFDESTASGKNFKAAWNTFRTIGLSLMLIIGLIMVISQAANLQIFDAYAFRKTLPRLLVAIIGIALSWEALEFVIIFFNDIGHWMQDLVLTPFKNAADPTSSNPFAQGAGIALVLSGALLGTAAGAITLGPLGIISLVITVFMAVLVGLFVLLTRSAIITMAILTAPLAIACWVLPGTKKVWDFWQNGLTTALLIFPIIMLFIGGGKAMSFVSENGIMKVLFLVLPYVLLPFAFRLAGGLMQTIFSLTNDRTRGAFDRLSNFRSNQRQSRMDDAINQTGKTWLSKTGGVGGVVGRPLGSLYRRGRMANEYGIRGIGGATYSAGLQKLREARAQEALKDDMGRAAGDDDANALALREDMSSSEFIRQYQANTGRSADQARAALRTLETGYGAKIGSDAMRVAAFKARAASNTGYDSSGNYQQISEDAASLVSSGLISTQDAAAAIKANQKRGDLNAIGFSSWMGHIDRSVDRYRQGARGAALVTGDESAQLRTEALQGITPGLLSAGRHETVRALAPQMVSNLNDTFEHVDADGNVVGTDDIAMGRELAKIAGRYDAMAQSNPLNAEIMANEVLSHTLGRAATDERFHKRDASGAFMLDKDGNRQVMSIREMIDMHGRQDPDFLTMRREYSTQAGYRAGAGGTPEET